MTDPPDLSHKQPNQTAHGSVSQTTGAASAFKATEPNASTSAGVMKVARGAWFRLRIGFATLTVGTASPWAPHRAMAWVLVVSLGIVVSASCVQVASLLRQCRIPEADVSGGIALARKHAVVGVAATCCGSLVLLRRGTTSPDTWLDLTAAAASASVFVLWAVKYRPRARAKQRLGYERILHAGSDARGFLEHDVHILPAVGVDGSIALPPVAKVLLAMGLVSSTLLGAGGLVTLASVQTTFRHLRGDQLTPGGGTTSQGPADRDPIAPESTSPAEPVLAFSTDAPYACNASHEDQYARLAAQGMPTALAEAAVLAYERDTRNLGCPDRARQLGATTWAVSLPNGEDPDAWVMVGTKATVLRRPFALLALTLTTQLQSVDVRQDWGLGTWQLFTFSDATCSLAEHMSGAPSILIPETVTLVAVAYALDADSFPAVHLRPDGTARGPAVYEVDLWQADATNVDGKRKVGHHVITLHTDGRATSPGAATQRVGSHCGSTGSDLLDASSRLRTMVFNKRHATPADRRTAAPRPTTRSR